MSVSSRRCNSYIIHQDYVSFMYILFKHTCAKMYVRFYIYSSYVCRSYSIDILTRRTYPRNCSCLSEYKKSTRSENLLGSECRDDCVLLCSCSYNGVHRSGEYLPLDPWDTRGHQSVIIFVPCSVKKQARYSENYVKPFRSGFHPLTEVCLYVQSTFVQTYLSKYVSSHIIQH